MHPQEYQYELFKEVMSELMEEGHTVAFKPDNAGGLGFTLLVNGENLIETSSCLDMGTTMLRGVLSGVCKEQIVAVDE